MLSVDDLPRRFDVETHLFAEPRIPLTHRRPHHPTGPLCSSSKECAYTGGRQWSPDDPSYSYIDPDVRFLANRLGTMTNLLPAPEDDTWAPPPLPSLAPDVIPDKYLSIDPSVMAATPSGTPSSTMPIFGHVKTPYPARPARPAGNAATSAAAAGVVAPPAPLLLALPSGSVLTLPLDPAFADAAALIAAAAAAEGVQPRLLRVFHEGRPLDALDETLGALGVPMGARLVARLCAVGTAAVFPPTPQFSAVPLMPPLDPTPMLGRAHDRPRAIGRPIGALHGAPVAPPNGGLQAMDRPTVVVGQ